MHPKPRRSVYFYNSTTYNFVNEFKRNPILTWFHLDLQLGKLTPPTRLLGVS